jgi:hypothetical protein
MSDIECKVTRVGVSERGQRTSFKRGNAKKLTSRNGELASAPISTLT